MIVNQTFSSVFYDSVATYNAQHPTAPSILDKDADEVRLSSDFEIYINAEGCQAIHLCYQGLPSGSEIHVETSQDPTLNRVNKSIANGVCGGKYIVLSGNDFPLNECANYQNAVFQRRAHAQTYDSSNAVLEQGTDFTGSVSGATNIIEIYRTISPFYKISFVNVSGATMSLSLLMVGDR